MSRRKFSVEEKMVILKESAANGITQTIRRHGIVSSRLSPSFLVVFSFGLLGYEKSTK